MMAHETPILLPAAQAPSGKTRKHKPQNQPKIQLPNGQKPDFGPAPRKTQQLPDGSKPNFGSEKEPKQKRSNKPQSKKNSSSKSSGESQLNDSSNLPSKKGKTGKGGASVSTGNGANGASAAAAKDCYAGSSFHSSPQAFVLPKPSFAAENSGSNSADQLSQLTQSNTPQIVSSLNTEMVAPALVNTTLPLANQSPLQQHVQQHMQHPMANMNTGMHPGHPGMMNNFYNYHPSFIYPGVPAGPPPKYPVTSYPPQGYNYGYAPPGMVPPYPQMTFAPVQTPPHGQKISFNELMRSSK